MLHFLVCKEEYTNIDHTWKAKVFSKHKCVNTSTDSEEITQNSLVFGFCCNLRTDTRRYAYRLLKK